MEQFRIFINQIKMIRNSNTRQSIITILSIGQILGLTLMMRMPLNSTNYRDIIFSTEEKIRRSMYIVSYLSSLILSFRTNDIHSLFRICLILMVFYNLICDFWYDTLLFYYFSTLNLTINVSGYCMT
jgi:hypothetical protein